YAYDRANPRKDNGGAGSGTPGWGGNYQGVFPKMGIFGGPRNDFEYDMMQAMMMDAQMGGNAATMSILFAANAKLYPKDDIINSGFVSITNKKFSYHSEYDSDEVMIWLISALKGDISGVLPEVRSVGSFEYEYSISETNHHYANNREYGFCGQCHNPNSPIFDHPDLIHQRKDALIIKIGAGLMAGSLINAINASFVTLSLRPDIILKGGRSGQLVKYLRGPSNSVFRGGSHGRIFISDDTGNIIWDVTMDRAKSVIPGQGFGPKVTPTDEMLELIRIMWGK
ncbi:MAG: hypothetical protein ACP5E3_01030, partial [Bacteroidales bacterium]